MNTNRMGKKDDDRRSGDSGRGGSRGGRGGGPGRRDFNNRGRNDRNEHFGADHNAGPHGGMGNDNGDQDVVALPENPNKTKFTGRCRLFVGNIPKDLKEEDFKKMFTEHGEVSECFISDKGFGFVTMDTRINAEKAKQELDGKMMGGRGIRVRFATHNAALKIKEIPAYVSNELLYAAFAVFGDVERAIHIVDERGRPTGEGIVEFARRPAAVDATRRIADGVFLLTTSPKPIIVEPLEQRDEEDGLMERMIPRNNQFMRERELDARFGAPGSFEFEFGNRWKDLYQNEKIRREQLENELQASRERLVGEMDIAYQEYQANLLREDLKRRQEELERLDRNRMQRMEELQKLRGADEPAMFGGVGGYGARGGGYGQQGLGGYGSAASYQHHQAGGGAAGQMQPQYPHQQVGGAQQGGEGGPPQHGFGPGARLGSNFSANPYDQANAANAEGNGEQAAPQQEGLVDGVKTLLQMFKGDGSQPEQAGASTFGMPPFEEMGKPRQLMNAGNFGGNHGPGMEAGGYGRLPDDRGVKRRRH